MTDPNAPQQPLFDNLGRRRQARWIEAAAKRDAEKAAWLNRDPEVVAADLRRLHELLFDHARWKFAYTMSDNPHSYTLRKTWERDEDFIWVCGVIRTIGDREAYPPPPNPASRWYRVYNTTSPRSGIACKFWTMNFPLGSLDWGWGRLNTMGTTLINRKPPHLPEDQR
jgi:hypothetical protein